MFQTIDQFLNTWNQEAAATIKAIQNLTDESLKQEITAENWTLGRIAWHISTSIKIFSSQAGLQFDAPDKDFPVPESASYIAEQYKEASRMFLEAITSQWNDEDLSKELNFFGQHSTNGTFLFMLITHQIHHRGQMTVLMRQAGVKVPGIYGPSKEEWGQLGMDSPPQ